MLWRLGNCRPSTAVRLVFLCPLLRCRSPSALGCWSPGCTVGGSPLLQLLDWALLLAPPLCIFEQQQACGRPITRSALHWEHSVIGAPPAPSRGWPRAVAQPLTLQPRSLRTPNWAPLTQTHPSRPTPPRPRRRRAVAGADRALRSRRVPVQVWVRDAAGLPGTRAGGQGAGLHAGNAGGNEI